MFNLINYLRRQKRFSLRTFGPGKRTKGVTNHIRKELIEIEENPHDLKEWIDAVTLALDGAWRAGYSPEEIVSQLEATLERNEKRKWPPWKDVPQDEAIEHVRSEEANSRSE
jgi:hypothetical protein